MRRSPASLVAKRSEQRLERSSQFDGDAEADICDSALWETAMRNRRDSPALRKDVGRFMGQTSGTVTCRVSTRSRLTAPIAAPTASADRRRRSGPRPQAGAERTSLPSRRRRSDRHRFAVAAFGAVARRFVRQHAIEGTAVDHETLKMFGDLRRMPRRRKSTCG